MKQQLDALGKLKVPSDSSYFGIVDLCGFKKDRFSFTRRDGGRPADCPYLAALELARAASARPRRFMSTPRATRPSYS